MTSGTSYVSIPNTGLRLPNGATTLNWYEEASYTGTWSNTSTTTVTGTLYVIRIGKQVTLHLASTAAITPSNVNNGPVFFQTLPSKFCPVSLVSVSNYNANVNPYVLQIYTSGVISIPTYTLNTSITPLLNVSYYTNAVTTAGASGASGASGSSSDPSPPNPADFPPSYLPNNNTTPITPP